MGLHHIALATRDAEATHRFYTEAMGFELVKVEVARTDGGWAKHLFYSTGPERDQLLAFWDLHDPTLPDDWSPAISTSQGLPLWINHLAFTAEDLDDLAARRDRWLAHGADVLEIDHEWCVSVYTRDPNGILVEFCTLTRALDEADRREALALLREPHPPVAADPPRQKVYKAADHAGNRAP